MDKILIVGINSNLARELVSILTAKKYDLKRITGIYTTTQCKDLSFIKQYNYTDIDKLKNDFKVIYLISAFVPRNAYNVPNKEFLTKNIELPLAIAIKFTKARIVFCSSVAVYGNIKEMPITEESHFCDPGLYGLSKIAGETIVRNHSSYAIIRFSSIYGNNIGPNNFINRAVEQALDRKKIVLYGNGTRKQNYINLQDAALLLYKCGIHKSNFITLGTADEEYSNNEVALEIVKNLPEVKIEYIEEDLSPSFIYKKNNVKKINFTAKISLAKGIRNILKTKAL